MMVSNVQFNIKIVNPDSDTEIYSTLGDCFKAVETLKEFGNNVSSSKVYSIKEEHTSIWKVMQYPEWYKKSFPMPDNKTIGLHIEVSRKKRR